MRRLVISTLLAGVLASAAGAQGEDIEGSVGPDFSISLRLADGSPVTWLKPGTYRFVITDRSDEHNLHLIGGGVDLATGVGAKGKTVWTVTLKEASYVFFCDPHFESMRGEFAVASAAAKKLGGSVGPGATITLAFGSAKVKTLKPGAYAITVRDRSTKDNFHLAGPGVNRKTGIASTSTTTWNVTLTSGTYTYRSDANAKLKGAFTVRA